MENGKSKIENSILCNSTSCTSNTLHIKHRTTNIVHRTSKIVNPQRGPLD